MSVGICRDLQTGYYGDNCSHESCIYPPLFARSTTGGNRDGQWTIAIDNKKAITYTIERVLVVPEGLGAFAAYAFDLNGNIVDTDEMHNPEGDYHLGGHVAILDLGYGTGDRIDIKRGVMDEDRLVRSTRDEAGIQYHMVQPILTKLAEDYGITHLTEVHVDYFLRSWALSGFAEDGAEFTIGGKKADMYALFSKQCHAYAQWVNTNLLVPAFREGVDVILTAGRHMPAEVITPCN